MGYSQEGLGRLIGMSKNNLSALENKQVTGMNRDSFRKLAELRSWTVEELRKEIGAEEVGGLPRRVTVDLEARIYSMLVTLAAADGTSVKGAAERLLRGALQRNGDVPHREQPSAPLPKRS